MTTISTATRQIILTTYAQMSCFAVMQAGQLVHFDVAHADTRSIVGDIYLGVVARVLPAMQAAFVDIGRQRLGFLSFKDVHPSAPLHAGQRLIVQVVKDELATKGAKLSTRISIACRHLVLEPNAVPSISVSKRQADAERLRTILQAHADDEPSIGRYVIRSRADADGIGAEYHALQALWRNISKSKTNKKPKLLHPATPFIIRAVNEWADIDGDIYVADRADFAQLSAYIRQYVPRLSERLYHADAWADVSDAYQGLLANTVDLPSGGSLIIDENAAMTTIDVNTGTLVASADIITKTNHEAATAIAHELRLRQLGGLIVVDFIDMTDDTVWQKVLQSLRTALGSDVPTTITSVDRHALAVISRARTQPSITDRLCHTCPTCAGAGIIKSFDALAFELFRQVLSRCQAHPQARSVSVHAHPDFITHLQKDKTLIAELGALSAKNIHLVEKATQPSQYQLIFT